jgi:hypothetical protein
MFENQLYSRKHKFGNRAGSLYNTIDRKVDITLPLPPIM